ncbi:unnamed protein product [Strongylus vulgaris]|uniref:Vps16 C-terminal domain-containing protein n=1 Tax=Strongylus vulgaris TaxID=40348 RepID=A0A3P7JQE3_STRVU|nr:unnamed protein product [Strongylus vulgaris]
MNYFYRSVTPIVLTEGFFFPQVSGTSRSVLLATILELRLRDYAEGNIEDAKCEELLIPFIEEENMTEALHLARVFHCFPVVQHILKKTGRTKELIQYYLKNGKIKEVVELCKNEKKSDMWMDLLVYISKKEGPVDEKVVQEMLAGSVFRFICLVIAKIGVLFSFFRMRVNE